jgi:hypothetical protein
MAPTATPKGSAPTTPATQAELDELRKIEARRTELLSKVGNVVDSQARIVYVLQHAVTHLSSQLAGMQGNKRARGIKSAGEDVLKNYGPKLDDFANQIRDFTAKLLS